MASDCAGFHSPLLISLGMESQTRKLLVIGARGYDRNKDGLRLDCVSWNKIADIGNVRDYDVLVLNLLNIATTTARNQVDWARFSELLNFSTASDILIHEGRIVVIGDPRFDIPGIKESGT